MLRLSFLVGLTVALGACGGSSSAGLLTGSGGTGGSSSGGTGGSSHGGTGGSSHGGTGGSSHGGTGGMSSGGAAGFSSGGTAGSSSGGTGATCGASPCGGNVTGTWTAQTACASGTQSVQIPNCSSSGTATVSNLSVSGTFKFDASGADQPNLTMSFGAHLVIPSGCLTAAQCSQLQTSYQNQQGVTNATCTFQGKCTCDFTETKPYNTSGTYTTSGTSLTITDSGGSPYSADYCVQGNTLTYAAKTSGANLTLVFKSGGP